METRDYMGPLKLILLATDGSESSEGAVKEAIYLAKSCVAKLSVIYVLETNPEFETEGLKFVEKMEHAAREHLEEIRKEAAAENVEIEAIVRRTDQPYKAIIEEAAKMKSDVIVMGRRGRTGLEKMLMGSVAAKVIGYAPCKVLVVPRFATISCKNILIATDGSKYSIAAATEAIGIAKRCKSNLIIVAAVHTEALSSMIADTGYTQDQQAVIQKEELQRAERNISVVKELAEKEGIHAKDFISEGRPYEAIVKAALNNDVDLIVVGSHGRTGISRFLMGSVTERVIGHAESAVLIVKAE
ncbi:MAG: universal stress protein [Thermodesulfovibrionales bacterium]